MDVVVGKRVFSLHHDRCQSSILEILFLFSVSARHADTRRLVLLAAILTHHNPSF